MYLAKGMTSRRADYRHLARSMTSCRADYQHRAGRMMRHLVGHRAKQEALGAGHTLVANDDQISLALLGDIEDRIRGIALARIYVYLDSRIRATVAAASSVASTSSRGPIAHCRSSGASRFSSRKRCVGTGS